MPSDREDWFIGARSEALAGLLLTARDDVRVRSEEKKEDGVDFLVETKRGDPGSLRLFIVQVRGTTSSDRNEWLQSVNPLFRVNPQAIYLPACVFVVNVRDNHALYAWVAEPLVENESAKLLFHPPGDFHDLNKAAVDEIVGRVNQWYDVLPRQLVAKPN
jgi:uncharacterized protein DUF4365